MKEIRKELKRLNSEGKLNAMDCLHLLELIVGHLEKPNTINLNLESLVGSLNVVGNPEDAKKTREMVTKALIEAINDARITKPQHYRIGNYFRKDGGLCVVEKITSEKINEWDLKEIQPDLINHYKLEGLGFEAKAMDRYELISGEKGILYHSTEEDISIMDGNGFRYCETYQDIKYVHQIQNIYFDLMQEELKYKKK